jgi:hypothetical protein
VNADSLQAQLAVLGLVGTLETRGTLAVLTVRDVRAAGDDAVRERAVALAARHGFTHLALELDDGNADRASLSGD